MMWLLLAVGGSFLVAGAGVLLLIAGIFHDGHWYMPLVVAAAFAAGIGGAILFTAGRLAA